MPNYRILKFDPIIRQLADSLAFQNNWRLFNNIQESDEDYMHSGFGRTSNDVTRLIGHMSWFILRTEEKGKEVILLDDFRNLLQCLPNVPSAKEYIELLLPSLFKVGLFQEIASIILEYYQNSLHEKEIKRWEALNFPEMYEKAGDNLLFLHNDPETAFIYYRLANATWNSPSYTDNRDASQKSLGKEIGIYEQLLRAQCPIEDDWSVNISRLADSYIKAIKTIDKAPELSLMSMDKLVEDVEKLANNRSRQLRAGCIMIEGIRRKYALKIINAVSREENKAEFNEAVLKWAANLYDQRYERLRSKVRLSDQASEEIIGTVYSSAKAASLVDSILELLRVNEATTTVVYYTTYGSFSYLLPDNCIDHISDCGKLSIMHLSYMNDPNEGNTIQRVVSDRNLGNNRRINPAYVFLKCFTVMKDYLPMWNMYADSAKGLCIEIETQDVNSLYHVCYVDDDNKIKEKYNSDIPWKEVGASVRKLKQLGKILDHDIFESLLEPIRYLFKDKSYSYEKEIRMVYNLERRDSRIRKTKQIPPKLMVIPENPINIREIMLGPKFTDIPIYLPYLQEQLDRMAEITGTKAPDITLSNIDFR